MDESAGVTRAWAAKRPRLVNEEKDEGEFLQKLPKDMILHILSLLSTTESWSLSRCNKKFHEMVNPLIFPLFKKAFDKRMLEICPVSPFTFIPKRHMEDYAFSGSLVWSTLLGKKGGEWGIQDIDIFFESDIDVETIIHREGFINPQPRYRGWTKSMNIGDDQYELYPVEYIAEGIPAIGDCIHVIRKDQGHEWGYVKVIDFVDAVDIDSSIARFDIEGCRSSLRGGVLTIASPADTLFMRSRSNFAKGEGRRSKYLARGITFI